MCHLFVSFFAFQKTGSLHCGCLWSLGSDFGQTDVRNIFNWHCIALHYISLRCIALVPFFSLLPLPPSPSLSFLFFMPLSSCLLSLFFSHPHPLTPQCYTNLFFHAYSTCTPFCRNPLIHNDTIYKLTPDGRRFFKNCAFVHAKADGIIKARRKGLQDDVSFDKFIDCIWKLGPYQWTFICSYVRRRRRNSGKRSIWISLIFYWRQR